jgi:phosphatidylglycerophosphate synthase
VHERIPVLVRISDWTVKPIIRFLHLKLHATPAHVTWAAFVFSVAAAAAIATGRVHAGLWLMFVGQVLDGIDGGMAREFGLSSQAGKRLDDVLDRASEVVIFIGFAVAGIVTVKIVVLALIAIGLMTTVAQRARFDPGLKRFALYFGIWIPYPLIFDVIFLANLAGYVLDLLIIDCHFQVEMDALGGDLDTVASRAAASEGGRPPSMGSRGDARPAGTEPVPADR